MARMRERFPRLELARIIVAASPGMALLAGALMLLAGVLPSATAAISGIVIGRLVSQARAGAGGLLGPMAALAGVFVLQQLVTMLRAGACEGVAARTKEVVSGRLMRAVLAPRTIAHLEDPSVLDLIGRARGRGWVTMENVASAFLNQQTTRLQGIGALVLIGRYQPWLTPLIYGGFV